MVVFKKDLRVMAHTRELFRVRLERTGEIRRGETVAGCELLDLTEKGVQFKTALPVEAGELLRLRFSLTDDCIITCTIQVARASTPYVGATIAAISSDDQQQLSRFIEQLNVLQMTGF